MLHPACMRILSSLADPVLSITAKELACVLLAACPAALSSHPSGLPTGVFAQPYSLDMPNQAPFGMNKRVILLRSRWLWSHALNRLLVQTRQAARSASAASALRLPACSPPSHVCIATTPYMCLAANKTLAAMHPAPCRRSRQDPHLERMVLLYHKERKPRWLGCR